MQIIREECEDEPKLEHKIIPIMAYKKIFESGKKEHLKSFIKSRDSIKTKKSDEEFKLPEISVKNESKSIEAKRVSKKRVDESFQLNSPKLLRIKPSIKGRLNERIDRAERLASDPAGVQSEVYKKLKINQYESQSPVKYSYLNCNVENAYDVPVRMYQAYSNEPKRLYLPSRPVWWG